MSSATMIYGYFFVGRAANKSAAALPLSPVRAMRRALPSSRRALRASMRAGVAKSLSASDNFTFQAFYSVRRDRRVSPPPFSVPRRCGDVIKVNKNNAY